MSSVSHSSIRFTSASRNRPARSRPPRPPRPDIINLNGTDVQVVTNSSLAPRPRPMRSSSTTPTPSPPLAHPSAASSQSHSFPPSPHRPANNHSAPAFDLPRASASSASSVSSASPPKSTPDDQYHTARRPRSPSMDIPIDLPPPPTVQETQVYTQPTTKHQLPAHIPPLPDIPTWQSQMEDDHYFDDENEDALSELSDDDEPESTGSLSAQNFFIHNGYRYDGDVYELRPPQERSIASRPQRILEHKPALLPNRQIFNRVYSEGTYNARPSSLRQPSNRSSARLSAGYASSEQADDEDSANMANKLNLDLPGCEPVPLPVTRPGSVRPAAPLSDTREALCDTIERVRQSAHATGDHKLQGLLAYSAVPVTRITGYKPTPPVASRSESKSVSLDPQGFATVGVDEFGGCDENVVPQIREKRGRSYASFAKSTPYASDVVKDSERKPFWKVLSR